MVRDLLGYGELLGRTGPDDLDLLEVLVAPLPKYRRNAGRGGSWRGCKDQVHSQIQAVHEAVAAVHGAVLNACAPTLGTPRRPHPIAAAEARREEGRPGFHDLLVLARKVRGPPGPEI